MGRRRYHTGTKRVDITITAWMVTLSMPAVVNMSMNLMGAGITVAHAVSPGIGKHSTFKEKYSTALYRDHQEAPAAVRHGFCSALHLVL